MFRRARLSVKPNVRPGVGTRGSAAPNPQRGPEAPRPPEPAPESAPKPAEPTDVPAVDSGGAEPQEQAPGSSDEKTGDETNAAESSTLSSAASQRRKRVSSTASPVQPPGSAPSQSRPSSEVNHDAPQPSPAPAKEKQPCSDRYRIYKARKLREMLKEELRKEKKQWKNKFATNESQRPPDRSKMTMRDFIYYLPDNNPMTSSVEQDKKTEKPLAPTPTRDRQENQSTQDANDNEEVEEEVDDGPLLVPRVKVAEDGSIILDEESLTVEVLRTKGPCVVEENDPIFERGSTTTYSSFRKNYYSKPWSNKETDMFFLAISMVGTDFSMIGQLFPHRARIEIKNKFKREEKTNGWRIDKAFQEKRPFDFDFFAHLLQKVLAEEEKRKQKSTKFQSLKEKASKPRRSVKAKTVASEEVNDDPDASVNSNISDPEQSQKDAQTVDEEESPSSSGQHLEQAVLEQDQNQEKKRRRKQGEASKQEATSLLERALVHPRPPEAGTPKGTCLGTCPSEETESNCNKEPVASFTQNIDDIAGLASSEEPEMRMVPIPSTSHQQDIMPLASESSESCAVGLSVSEPGSATSADIATAESSCSEGRRVGPKTDSPETGQTENVKPKSRSRLLRPKPNLSRAVGKKSTVSQDRQDERNKNSPSETAADKNNMGKERVNESENFVAENTDRVSPGAETVSDLSEKSCVQEDSQAKVLRPTRLMRSRMQRPKPNVVKAAARKEILPSQDKGGAHGEEVDDGSCVVIPPQVENESHKNLQCEDTVSQPDKKDPFENKQSDQPKVLNECPSIQEGNKGNKLKQTPVLRTRFQKPKPNTGRRRRSSKEGIPEEMPVSGEITTWEEIPRPDASPREEVPSVPLAPFTATASTTGLESDVKDSGRNDIASSVKMSEMTDVTMEMQTGLETVGRDTCPGEMGAEMIDIPMETEAVLKASLDETSMEKVPELIDTTGEICTNLGETGRKEIFLQENGPKEVSPVSEPETGLQETGKELAKKESTPDMMGSTEERDIYSEETESQETSAPIKDAEEAKARGEMETPLGETEGRTSQREKTAGAPVEQPSASEENPCGSTCSEEVEVESGTGEGKECNLKETGEGDNSLMAVVSGEKTTIEETNGGDRKETERESSVSWERASGEIPVGEAVVADLGKPEEIDVSPRDREPEGHSPGQPEADGMPSGSDGSPGSPQDRETISSKISVMPTLLEEKEASDKDVSSLLCHVESSSHNSGSHEAGQGMQLPDALERFSDINLSKPLPQEQKSLQVKPTPFLRSRFKKPKPNLSRAALKRATIEAEHCVPGKKSEAYKMETAMLQQDSDQAASLSCPHNVPSLMASRENDKAGHDEEEAVILPCTQAEKDPSPPNAWEPKEDFQLTQTQENGLVVPIGTQTMNTVTQETKQNVVQTTLPVRGRLQRPRPNVQRARQRQTVGKGEAGGSAKNGGPELQNDKTKACLTVASSSRIESELAVEVSSRDSEYKVSESPGHAAPVENLSSNKTSVVEQEQIRHENKPNVPSPALLIRRRFQKAKPNLGGARHKGEHPSVERGQTDESTALTSEDRLPQKGDGDIQLSPQAGEKTEMPVEVSVRKECVHSEEWSSDRDDAQPKAEPSGGAGGEMAEGQPASSSGLEEQSLRKQVSRPQLLKESSYPKTVPHQRTTPPCASECEIDHSGKRTQRKTRPNVTKGRGPKRIRGKTAKKEPRASKSMLVTLRASQKEDEDDAEDFDSDYEEETYHLAPEELNKAPVFVPVGLRSPEPVSAQIEETMEELEITMDVADMGCVTVVEHQLSHTDTATQDVQPEKAVYPSPFEMVIGEQTQEEQGPSDGSTEAAITLLTMGDIVLQSEIIPGQGDVGVCVFPDVHSKDKSHVPFSPDNVNQKIVHDYQEVCSPVVSMSHASFEENTIVSKEQTNREAAVMEEAMEETLPTRNTASTMSTHLSTESMVVTPKPNSEILEIRELDGPPEAASLCITKGTEVEIQQETEGNDSKSIELEDESLEPVTTAETKEQKQRLCVHDGEAASDCQEAILPARIEDRENSQELLLGAVAAPSETGQPTLDSGLGERAAEEALKESPKGSAVPLLHVPESVPSNIPEAQQENTSPQDVTVNLFANGQQDGEDEQAFILTLVEIPASATQGFADASMQLTPSSLLPAPILVRSGRTSGKGDPSGSLQASSVVQDAACLSPRSGDSEKPPVNLDLTSRKRFCCSPDDSIHVPPAKKSSMAPGIDYQEGTSEVCSEELNVSEKTVESSMGQGIFPTSESTHATSKPQKEHSEPTFQNIGSSGSLDEIKDACVENTMTQLPQSDKVSEREEKTEPASNSEQRDSGTSSSKPPLTRPGRRPLGFLSLICPKNSLESDEVTQTHSKKRLKPQIPVSRRNLRKPNTLNASQKKNQETSDPLPSSSVTDTPSDNTGNSESSATQVSSDQPLLEEKCKNGPKGASEEEVTPVSELVFSDIFIEVDETE